MFASRTTTKALVRLAIALPSRNPGQAAILTSFSTKAEPQADKKKPSPSKKAVESSSFVQNIFRGIVEPEQGFPYPEVLTEDQMETLQVLVPTAEKFFNEENDSMQNDLDEQVPEKVIQVC